MRTYDDYIRNQEELSHISVALGYGDDETLERCPMCGDCYPVDDLDDYKGQRMCSDCIELERTNDATKSLYPDFGALFQAV